MNDEYKVRCYKIDDNVISVKCFVSGEQYSAVAFLYPDKDLEFAVSQTVNRLLSVIPYRAVNVVELTLEVYTALRDFYKKAESKCNRTARAEEGREDGGIQ